MNQTRAPAALVAEDEDGLPVPRRYWAVATIWLALLCTVMDGSISNVALPTIGRELHAMPSETIWVVSAYQLAITICLLPLSALGDKLGYVRVYMIGLAIYTAGALCSALSPTMSVLVFARMVQGVGAAGVMSVNTALVRHTYPHRLLGRGIGLNALVLSIGSCLGPTVAAGILSQASWHWLFAVNVPAGLLALVLAPRSLPRTPGSGKPFDWISALLSAATFGCLIKGIDSVARHGPGTNLVLLAVGALAAAALARRELWREAPMVPFDLLRIPMFGASVVTSVVSFAAQTLAFVALPFYFQDVLGRSAVAAGLLMTPWSMAVGLTAPLSGRLADRYSAGLLCGVGLTIFAGGLASLATLSPGAQTLDIVWRMVLCGLGFGIFQSPNNRAMVASAPKNRSGAAGGMLATARLLGQTAGAVTIAVFFHTAGPKAAITAFATGCVVALVAAGMSLLRMKIGSQAPAKPTLEEEAAVVESEAGARVS